MTITLHRGTDATLRLTVTDDDAGGARLDLTGATIDCVVKGAATLTKAVGAGITVLDQSAAATRGQADVDIPRADLVSMPDGRYDVNVFVEKSGRRALAIDRAVAYVRTP